MKTKATKRNKIKKQKELNKNHTISFNSPIIPTKRILNFLEENNETLAPPLKKRKNVFEVKVVEISESGEEKTVNKYVTSYTMNKAIIEVIKSYNSNKVRIARISKQNVF